MNNLLYWIPPIIFILTFCVVGYSIYASKKLAQQLEDDIATQKMADIWKHRSHYSQLRLERSRCLSNLRKHVFNNRLAYGGNIIEYDKIRDSLESLYEISHQACLTYIENSPDHTECVRLNLRHREVLDEMIIDKRISTSTHRRMQINHDR